MIQYDDFIQIIFLLVGFILMRMQNKLLITVFIFIYFKITALSFNIYFGLVVGLLLSPIVLNLTYYIVFKKWLFQRFVIKKSKIDLWTLFNNALIEEIIWRDLILVFLIINTNNIFIIFLNVLLLTYFFVLTHKVKFGKKMLEMLLFSLIISISSLVAFGLHYGLHIGRNIYIAKTLD